MRIPPPRLEFSVIEFECFLPGATQPITLEAYSAYIKGRLEIDKEAGVESVGLLALDIYGPEVEK